MKIDDVLIDSLLFEEESVSLDFKRTQYRFVKASDDEKNELLKDILAFANAWRRTDAFIIIGVEEVKGGRSRVLGISEPLDDAAIQQFVNRKTQRPIAFSYRNLTFEGKQLGLIHIPCQERPFYLQKDFGKLKANTVYIRRGSSTDEASLDEIAKMGAGPSLATKTPQLDVFFAAPSTLTRIQGCPLVQSLVLATPPTRTLPDYDPPRSSSGPWEIPALSLSRHYNRAYYRELANFTVVSRLVAPFYLAVANDGEVTAHDVRLELTVPGPIQGIKVIDSYDYPSPPRKEYELYDLIHSSRATVNYDVYAELVGTVWIVKARAEKVQPKATHWFKAPFYLGSTVSQELELSLSIYADNLEKPHQQILKIRCEAEERKADLAAILELERERYLSSPEFKRLLEEHGTGDKDN